MKILVLGLGNDLLADDAAGILAARGLLQVFSSSSATSPRSAEKARGRGRVREPPSSPSGSGPAGAGAGERNLPAGEETASAEGAAVTVDVVESSLSGVALLDLFLGYDKAIIIDAVQTGRAPAGTIHELAPEELGSIVAPSPHYTGLPELLELAKTLDLQFPGEIAIFAIEVQDPHTIGGALSAPVQAALPDLAARVASKVRGWSKGPPIS